MSRRLPPTPQTPFILGEVHDIPFRFGREMQPGESIVSVQVDCLSIGSVSDPVPLNSVGGYQVQDTIVLQRFSALVANARYIVVVTAAMNTGRVFIGRALCFVLPVAGQT
jgi:hypothetical protein